jgi:protein SCO1
MWCGSLDPTLTQRRALTKRRKVYQIWAGLTFFKRASRVIDMWRTIWTLLILTALSTGCQKPAVHTREFPLTGEIVAIKPDRTEVTVKHDNVVGFMEAMTMPFPVKEPALLQQLAPGDLIKATLVITDEESFLTAITRTGSAPPGTRAAVKTAVPDLAPGEAVPDIVLVADDGRETTLASRRGSFVLVTFIYTRCPLPDYCPRMDAYFKVVQDAVTRSPRLKNQVRLLSISFDPDFDTPARLQAHARQRGADPAVWQFATAPSERVAAFGARVGLEVIREGVDGSNITHNLRTALVGRDGTLVKTYNGNGWSPDEVIRDLETLAAKH